MDDSLKDAVKFISDAITSNPEKNRSELIELAAQRYDLNPLQEEFLVNKFVIS
jgi:hypothetical protein